MVMSARGDAPEARAALGELCEAYWMPVFRFLRREGRSEDGSRELAQEFFTRILSVGGIDGVDPAKGRFRSYLLGALKHFLADRKRSERRQRRGGGARVESIDAGGTDTSPGMQLPDPLLGICFGGGLSFNASAWDSVHYSHFGHSMQHMLKRRRGRLALLAGVDKRKSWDMAPEHYLQETTRLCRLCGYRPITTAQCLGLPVTRIPYL